MKTKQEEKQNNFIEKAEIVHNYNYSYTNVNYVTNKIKVDIICAVHGVFQQTPSNHLMGRGCQKCGHSNKKPRIMTLELLIVLANKKHNNKYNYMYTIYKNSTTPIEIICNEHGSFWQKPCDHLKGSGCTKCRNQKYRKTKEKFVGEANSIHGNKYNYESANYVNSLTKLKVICGEHGEFFITPITHLDGAGCPSCFDCDIKNTFIRKANIIHHGKYMYGILRYQNCDDYIDITCPEHGLFNIKPKQHLKGRGCDKCLQVKKNDMFSNRANKIHNNKYNYSNFSYSNNEQIINIFCDTHGEFQQTVKQHLRGLGCKKCNRTTCETAVCYVLNKLNIDFKEQVGFENCKHKNILKFDFFIEKYNLLIEYDGQQHFMAIKYFGGEKNFEKTQIRDNIKNNYCLLNNINLLRIKYNITDIQDIEKFIKTAIFWIQKNTNYIFVYDNNKPKPSVKKVNK